MVTFGYISNPLATKNSPSTTVCLHWSSTKGAHIRFLTLKRPTLWYFKSTAAVQGLRYTALAKKCSRTNTRKFQKVHIHNYEDTRNPRTHMTGSSKRCDIIRMLPKSPGTFAIRKWFPRLFPSKKQLEGEGRHKDTALYKPPQPGDFPSFLSGLD